MFIFIITDGIWLSRWCLEELKSAVANNKKIVVVSDLNNKIPEALPEGWEVVGSHLRQAEQLIWIAEFNTPCLKALKRIIGPSDSARKYMQMFASMKEPFVKEWQSTGVLNIMNGSLLDPGFLRGLIEIHADYPLREISMSQCRLSEDDFYAVRNAESIDISSCLFRDTDVDHEYPNLKRLKMAQLLMTDVGLHYFLKDSSKLESLKISECTKITDGGVQSIAMGKVPRTLQALKLKSCIISDEGVKALARLHNLKELEVSDCPVNEGLIPVINGCTKLTALRASSADLSDATVIELGKLKGLTALDIGRNLCLHSSWAGIIKEFRALEEVNVGGTQVQDEVLVALVTHHGGSLKILAIDNCMSLTTKSISLIPQHCHNLEILRINDQPVGDDFFAEIATKCPNITILEISSTKITDEGVQALAKGLQLKRISVANTKVTAAVKQMFDLKKTQLFGVK